MQQMLANKEVIPSERAQMRARVANPGELEQMRARVAAEVDVLMDNGVIINPLLRPMYGEEPVASPAAAITAAPGAAPALVPALVPAPAPVPAANEAWSDIMARANENARAIE